MVAADVTYPGARTPDRQYRIDANGIELATYEWGDADAPPLLCVHGGFDFARTYDVFAPLLAAGGWRVVSWDQRGHGDSDRAPLYSWDADLRDALAVFDHVSPGRPVPGHRALQGRRDDDPARRRPAVPDLVVRQPRRRARTPRSSPTSPSTTARR